MDETDQRIIRKFVAFRKKAYTFILMGTEQNKDQGIRGDIFKNHMTSDILSS